MSDNQTNQEQVKTVKLWSRCEAALLDAQTGEVTLTPGVDPKFLVQDLVRDIQTLQAKLQSLESKTETKTEEVKDI